MEEVSGIKFACPNCGQHFEADIDMAGSKFECPSCGCSGDIPTCEAEIAESKGSLEANGKDNCGLSSSLKIIVVKKRERFIDKFRRKVKAIGIGVGVLLLFVGLGAIRQIFDDDPDGGDVAVSSRPNVGADGHRSGSASSHVAASVECLLNFLKVPTERRLRSLSESLEKCPDDFQDAVKEYLASATKTTEDMISAREREEMVKGKAVLGLLFGAVNQNDPQSGVAAGLQMGDLICAEAEEKAKKKLRLEIESKIGHLVDVAQKYGIDSNALEDVLLCR